MKINFKNTYDDIFNDAECFLIGFKGLSYDSAQKSIDEINHIMECFNIMSSNQDLLIYNTIDRCLNMLEPFTEIDDTGDIIIVKVESKSKEYYHIGSLIGIFDDFISIKEDNYVAHVGLSGKIDVKLNLKHLCYLYDVDVRDVGDRILLEKSEILDRSYVRLC